jgi:hypothetical protein
MKVLSEPNCTNKKCRQKFMSLHAVKPSNFSHSVLCHTLNIKDDPYGVITELAMSRRQLSRQAALTRDPRI